jgi:hypothetical protein
MAESKAVDIPDRATPFEAGEPREEPAISQFGATFAERQKAREKAVSSSSGGAENKAVKKASTKKKAAKKS